MPPRAGRSDGDLPKAAPVTAKMRPARVEIQPEELITSAGDGLVAFDRDLKHTVWNPRMEELTGVSPDAALGRGVVEIFPPTRHGEITGLLERALSGETVTSDDFVWSSSETVVERWLSAVFAPHRDAAGGIRGVVGAFRDVTARRMVAEVSAPIAPEFRRLVEQSVVGMYVLQDGRYRYANPRLAATLGYTQAEILAFDSVVSIVALDDHALVLSRVRQTLEGNEDGVPYTFHAIHKSGRPVEVEVLEAAIELDGRPAIVGTLSDVTERRRAEAQIVAQAYNDPLTKLPNRARLLDRLDVDLAQAKRHGRKLAVVYVDIDFFKYVNDSWGHSLGDNLLQSLALRLKRSVREADTVARMGGDEFVILVPELRQSEDLASIAQKLLALIGKPFSLEGRTIHIAASIGIASFPEDGTEPEELLRNADAAMYRAKELGRNNFQLCTRELTERAAEHLDAPEGPASRPREGGARPPLPAHHEHRHGADGRPRGAGPLAAPAEGHGRPDDVHPGGRGDRPDPAARRLGASFRLRAAPPLAQGVARRPARRGQLLRRASSASAISRTWSNGRSPNRTSSRSISRSRSRSPSRWKAPRSSSPTSTCSATWGSASRSTTSEPATRR